MVDIGQNGTMLLHPEIEAITASMPIHSFPEMEVDEARHAHAAGAAGRPKGPDMADVTEFVIGGCEVTRLRPKNANGSAVVFFHGGGWVLGSRATHDGPCRHLAARSAATVFNVEYRLAPEHPFPAAHDDAVEVTRALLSGADDSIDGSRVAVAGDSAGGNLAVVAALALRDAAATPAALLLIYPAVDATMSTPSYLEFADGPFLTASDMAWFYDTYAQGTDPRDQRLSPAWAAKLDGLPSTLIITASHDVLRDEGEEFARAMAAAGCDASASRHVGATHGFFGWSHAATPSRTAMTLAAGWLSETLS